MHCPSCNTPNRDDAKFCKGCGRSFSVSQPADAINQVPTPSSAVQYAPSVPISMSEDAINRVPTPTMPVTIQEEKKDNQYVPAQEDMQDKTQLAPAQGGAEGSDIQAQTQPIEEDPSLVPTLILTPERMVAYHQRRWQAGSEQGSEGAINRAPTAEIDDTPTAPASPPSANAQNIADMPTVLTGASDENEVIPIPPRPPPMENGAVEGTETSHPQNSTYGGVYPDMEKSETMQQPSEQTHVEQSEGAEHTEQAEQSDQSGQPEQATSSGDFPVMPVGTTLQGRYEITQVISDSPQEHEYHVIDHQGYQRCWNCGSEQNSQGDDFCNDCGASLLDVPYIMHEYSAQENQDESHVLQGNINNTFVDQGHTYVIEQIQAQQSAFPNGVQLVAASYSDAGNVRRSEPNEDSTLVLELQRVHESFSAPVGIFIVADGLGGHD